MRIRDLFIYPLKSGAGMRVTEATIDALGFAGDRRWMAVDSAGRFLSQRRIPSMATIQATLLSHGGLYLSAPAATSLEVMPPDEHAADRDVVVWHDTVRSVDAGDEAAAWLSSVLGEEARLVHCPPSRARIVDREYASGNEQVGFADGFPLLVLGYGSVHELNARLRSQGKSTVGVERFRPNIVIEDAEPWAEDGWRHLEITSPDGAIRIEIVKPCARCSIISVEPRTGEQGTEPMRTLATYRRRGADVYVAQNALPRGEGRVATGAAVRVV